MIDIKSAPPIPGLEFRHFKGESDYSQLAAVITASEAADQTERTVSAADVASAYQHLNNCDPHKDVIIAEVAGRMVGYARGWWEHETLSGRSYKHNGFLLPEWRRKGIGQAMSLWMEAHFHEAATSNPPGTANFFQVSVTQVQKGAAMMLERAGYQAVRYFFEMVRPSLDDIIEFPLPTGLEVRVLSSDQYRALWKLVDETSKDEWGYREPTEDDFQEWLGRPHFQPHLWQVAWEIGTDRPVGHVLTFIESDENEQFNRKRGYTEGVGVHPSWRRRGLARALISRSLQAQKAAGMSESALVADSENASNVTRLYESCGFRIVKRDTIYRKSF